MSEREAPNSIEKGTKRYRERIHRESKRADLYGNLPYTFSKPQKIKARTQYVECDECGHHMFVTEQTVIVICSSCNNLVHIKR